MTETTGWKLGDLADDPFSNIPGAYDEDTFAVPAPAPKPAAEESAPNLADITTLDDLGHIRFEAEKRWFHAVNSRDSAAIAEVERELVAICKRGVELAKPMSFEYFAATDALYHWRTCLARTEREAPAAA